MARLPIATTGLIDYKNGTDTEVWISPVSLTRAQPTPTTYAVNIYALDLVPAVPILKLGLSATTEIPLDRKLPHGFRIKTVDGQIFVVDASSYPIDDATSTRFVPITSKTIPIVRPTALTLTLGVANIAYTAAEYVEYLTFYSCSEATFKADGDEINYRNFGEGVYDIGRKSKMKLSFDTNGFVTPGDSILKLVRRCAISTTESLKVLYIPPDDQALEFFCDVKSDDRSSKVDTGYEAKFSYAVTKAPVNIDLTPS